MMAWVLAVALAPAGGVACIGVDCFPTLQAAVDQALPGETILVQEAELTEVITVGVPLTIVGAGATLTTLAPAAASAPALTATADLTLEGFTVRASLSGAIAAPSARLTLTDVDLATSPFTLGSATLVEAGELVADGVRLAPAVPIADGVVVHGALTAIDLTVDGGTFGGSALRTGAGFAGGAWSLTDVTLRDVASTGPTVEAVGPSTLVATRLALRCPDTPSAALVVDSPSASLGPLLAWKGGGEPLVALAGSGAVGFATLVQPGGTALRVDGAWEVRNSALVAATGFEGGAAAAVSAAYNRYDTPIAATGSLTPAQVGGTGVSAGEATFLAYTADGPCRADILAPGEGSALVDGGDPGVLDGDGSRADIGATGGPDGFVLVVDADGDGFTNALDCDDEDPDSYPQARDVAHDGIDQDCDGVDNLDGDGDGFDAAFAGGTDCDDDDPLTNPDAVDERGGADQDCDGFSGPSTPLEIAPCSHGGRAPASLLLLLPLVAVRRRREVCA